MLINGVKSITCNVFSGLPRRFVIVPLLLKKFPVEHVWPQTHAGEAVSYTCIVTTENGLRSNLTSFN